MTLQALADSVRTLPERLPQMVGDVLRRHETDIMELQRIQLLEGHDSDGNDMRPYYTEDVKPQGYFNSRESAGRYAAWKEGLSYPFSVSRNSDAPNLYINGRFHSELAVIFGNDGLSIEAQTPYAAKIVAKYGRNSFGLSMEKWNTLFNERGIKDEVIQQFRQVIYGS